jgi:hypothetical protein
LRGPAIAFRAGYLYMTCIPIEPDLAVSALTAFSKNTQNLDVKTHANGLRGASTPLRVL